MLHGLARRLDKPMGALGVLFVLVVLGQALARPPTLSTALTVVGWVLWAVSVAEFALRAWLARHHARRFWRRNWWQVILLAVPFLRFARAATLRAARAPRRAHQTAHAYPHHHLPSIDRHVRDSPLVIPVHRPVTASQPGQATGLSGVRARTRIRSPSSVTSSITSGDNPENTIFVRSPILHT
ncbi:hypothetical protein SAMN05443287_12033 [Micromonospora phaseoli]|uniref:Voltage-gated potassium channel n=1 Tax=Micromonospora phaseoli TaxID=1144548 RepID=A0A1H7DWM8_9ACTN|nr:hypothetical protein CLV64_1217 [Micromonospora phaseoli]GIJ81409.1 hypothetical protein Xph01_58410 [Micromonospora phaseoli]SEK06179.1 hypothetical protein SAMN05443287_12033 [Micromonospora phaseoli]